MIPIPDITKALARLIALAEPKKIILFGSQARGDADSRSDVDLLVVCPFVGSRRKMMADLSIAMEGFGKPVDIIVISPEEYELERFIPGTVARPAWLEGVLLYESD